MSENPYSAPQYFDAPISSPKDVEEIRRKHLPTEASIKALGILYTLGALACAVAAAGLLVYSKPLDLSGLGTVGILVAVGVLNGFAAYGMRRLKPWARILGVVLSVPGLVGFPIGTILSAYIIYLLISAKGRFVCSPEYKEIVAATPHMKYKTSKWAWMLLAAFVALLVILVVLSA